MDYKFKDKKELELTIHCQSHFEPEVEIKTANSWVYYKGNPTVKFLFDQETIEIEAGLLGELLVHNHIKRP